MTDSVITLKDQKFRKVKGVWVDQKKTPAPKDLIAILDKLSAAEAASAEPGEAKEAKPALPVLPIAAKDFSTAKLESSINRLIKVIETLSKRIQVGESRKQSANQVVDGSPSQIQKIFEPGKIPTLREAMKLNTRDFFRGATNKYGEKDKPGLLRTIGEQSFPVIGPAIFAARDRRRSVIGNELREYENVLSSNNPNLSKKQIDAKIAEKRKELENPKATAAPAVQVKSETTVPRLTKEIAREVAQMKTSNPELTSAKALEQIRSNTSNSTSGEKEREKTMVQGKSEFASPDVDKDIIAVKITEIDESVLKKLSEIFGKKDDKESPDNKEENKPESNDAGEGGSFFDRMRNKLSGGGTKRSGGGRKRPRGRGAGGATTKAEQLLDKNGKPLQGAAKASREAKLAAEAASSAENTVEQVAKKPGILSKIFGGGTKTAGIQGAEKLATKAGGSLLSKGVRGIPVLGAIAGAGLSGYGTYKESGSIGKALFSGGGSLLGGLGGEIAGTAVAPGVGTVAGGIAGSIGGGKVGEGAYDKIFGKKNTVPGAIMAKPIGVTPQTQVLTATTKKVETAKQQRPAASPTIINNNVSSPTNVSSSQGVIGGPTVADRGSLNLASF